uniref:C-type lectin domain-containing protein n=1 Tax=Panagrolaimus superbus TaxID=310955 RepID=A0A914YSI8_9BILA
MYISGKAYTVFNESTDADFWIGANDIQSTNKWSWTDNTSFDFSSWDKGQPQSSAGPVCVSSTMNGARWSTFDCFISKPYVCEVKASLCPEGWTYFKRTNFCYKLVQNEASWSEAEKACVNEKSHLVSLHSYEEALFVTAFATNLTSRADSSRSWIGLSTPDNNTTWEWTDGTPFDYKNWGINEPDGHGVQNCGIMWISQPDGSEHPWANPTEWDNLQCSAKILKNVCKKPRNV